MKLVGYLINTAEGLAGEPGLFYDYILANNGLFIRARSPLLAATVCIAETEVRGLSPLTESVELPKGKIPQSLFDLALKTLAYTPHIEQYMGIIWGEEHCKYNDECLSPAEWENQNGVIVCDFHKSLLDAFNWETRATRVWKAPNCYRIKYPPQQRDATSVKYATLPNTVVDIHSHGSMGAFFSNTDNQDEQGLRLYMVVGKLDTLFPEVRLRVGVYGYFRDIQLEEVFHGLRI